MSGLPDEALVKVGPWPGGLNTLSQENEVPLDQLRQAVNVDLDREGIPSVRQGQTLRYTGTRTHSLWSDPNLPFGLFVDNGTLKAFWPDTTTTVLKTGLAVWLPLAYALIAYTVYWSNGQQSGTVNASGTTGNWGVETPDGQANLAPASSGALSAGTYQVTFTFQAASGEESGAWQAATVVLTDGQGIAVTSIPQPQGTGVTVIRAYRSGANGDALYWCRDMPVGMTSVTLTESTLGKPLDTQFLDRMLPVTRAAVLNGRIYGASGSDLVWSEAIRYGLTHPLKNRIGFGYPIDLLQAVGDGTEDAGLFVASGDRTYFLAGNDPRAFARRIVYGYGAIAGTGIRIPGAVFGLEQPVLAPVAYWIASNGIACIGQPGGTVFPIRDRQAQVPLAQTGASLLREQNGMRQVITALRGPAGQGMAITDTTVATVYRNGVPVP